VQRRRYRASRDIIEDVYVYHSGPVPVPSNRHRRVLRLSGALAAVISLLVASGCGAGEVSEPPTETTEEIVAETAEVEAQSAVTEVEQEQSTPVASDLDESGAQVNSFAPVLNELVELNERVARDGGYLDPIPGLVDDAHGRAMSHYALVDINGDGINELVLGAAGDNDGGIKSLYALVGGEPALIEQFTGRNYGVIAQDGTIYNLRSGGATLNSLQLWRLEPGAATLSLVREYTQDGDTITPQGMTTQEFQDLWPQFLESDNHLVLDWRPVSGWPYETQTVRATSLTEQMIAAIENGDSSELAALLGDPVQVYRNFDAGTAMSANDVANLLLSTVSDPREWIRQAQESSLEDDLCSPQSESDWEDSPLGEWQHESPFVVICNFGGSSPGNATVGLTWAPTGENLHLERLDIMDNTNVQEIGD